MNGKRIREFREKCGKIKEDESGGTAAVMVLVDIMIIIVMIGIALELMVMYRVHSEVESNMQKVLNAAIQSASYYDYRMDYQGAGSEADSYVSSMEKVRYVYDPDEISTWIMDYFRRVTTSENAEYVSGTNAVTYQTAGKNRWTLSDMRYTFEAETGFCCMKAKLSIYPAVTILGNVMPPVDTNMRVVVRDTRVDYNPDSYGGGTTYTTHDDTWNENTYITSVRDYMRHFNETSNDENTLSYNWKRLFE